MTEKWFSMEVEEVVEMLRTDSLQGLENKEAELRLAKYGLNQLTEKKKITALQMFIAQFKDFMVMILLGAALVSGVLGEVADTITIFAIIMINACLGFIQERRAEKSMEALKKLTAPEASVIREGEEISIPAKDLVPGDIVVIETGDRIPADIRLFQAINLEVDESLLTGESVPVKKSDEGLIGKQLGVGEQKNIAFSGTVITRGRGKGIVIGTGMGTEMGQIAGLMQDVKEEDTPLQKRLEQLGKWLVVLCLLISAIVVGLGIYQGKPLFQMFLAGVSLAVAAIPEGLPAVVTIALAVGVQKMIRRNAIIRKLPAVETLGCATVICSDKTGTLTQNEMTVRQVWANDKIFQVTGQGYDPKGDILDGDTGDSYKYAEEIEKALAISVLCNNSMLRKSNTAIGGLFRRNKNDRDWNVVGDPTEGALLVLGAKGQTWREKLEKNLTRIEEIPFDSDRKRMTVVYRDDKGAKEALIKGAPDVVLSLCSNILINGKVLPLKDTIREHIKEQNGKMANQALRVLALAYRELPPGMALDADKVETGLTFVALTGMIDPPRPQAKKAIEVCKKAGIRTVMITGDHHLTALAVAKELGMMGSEDKVMTGQELEQTSDKAFKEKVKDIAVYARVSPKHKLRIVKALKQNGHVVAMTGDGVNDAPAVKEADIGISMGKTGTDVTKEASAMVLGDDDFATIVAAVEEGRGIYDNVRKFIRYLLSCNIGEVLVMFLAAIGGLPLPLLPIQILWVNLVTDGLPAMALGVDNNDPDIMSRKPRSPKESVFSQGLGRKIVFRGVQIAVGTLVVFVLGLVLSGYNVELARTMAFTTLVFSQLFHVFDCKSERHSVFEVGVFSNPYLIGAVIISASMQMTVLYVPFFQSVFKTVPLSGLEWMIILAVAGGKTFFTAVMHFIVKPVFRRLAILKV
ncbi:MAG: calcium-transporting P-type ATPase, PMR1-type [Bacillota bacterium]|nr:calcium-transporting P-type ATPase, PMR1-type [Bacillota bacterium]